MGILRGHCALFDGAFTLPSKRRFPFPSRGTCQIKSKLAQFTAAENHGCLGLDAQGSIDVPTIRDQVASILEGGRSAFIQRKEKYEF